MTNNEIASIVAAVVTALNASKPAAKRKNYAPVKSRYQRYAPKLSAAVVDAKTDKALDRLASVARGFNAKGIANSDIKFKVEGQNSHNIRTFKDWIANGRIVRKGQHGVKGMFHVSQTDVFVQPKAVSLPVNIQIGDQVPA